MRLRIVLVALLGLVTGVAALAQQTGPALTVDAAANPPTISSDVYEINYYWHLGSNGDPNVQPGNQVTVHVTVGGAASQDGVTLAVR